jgi:hypothetical protein
LQRHVLIWSLLKQSLTNWKLRYAELYFFCQGYATSNFTVHSCEIISDGVLVMDLLGICWTSGGMQYKYPFMVFLQLERWSSCCEWRFTNWMC